MGRKKKQIALASEQVEQEIARLSNTKAVRVARAEQRKRYTRRQYLYQLRSLEKRGIELLAEAQKRQEEDDDYDAF